MKNQNPVYRIMLWNVAIVVTIGIIVGAFNALDGFGIVLGIICLIGGLIDILLSFILLIAASKIWSKSFLLSAGILLLLSGISCGTGLANTNFH